MDTASLARLLVLAAIWGGSFLFMRIAVPALGPTLLIAYRVGLAAVFLAVVAVVQQRRLDVRAHWRHYLVLGACNSAVPFLLFAFAAQTLSASLLSILNATAPIFAALIASLGERAFPAPPTAFGLMLGPSACGEFIRIDFTPSTAQPLSHRFAMSTPKASWEAAWSERP